MNFELIREPKNNSKPEILFYQILQISYDHGTLTSDILDNDELYQNFKKSIYNQFNRLTIEENHYNAINLTDHPSQLKGDKYGQCLCTQHNITTYFIIQNTYTKKKCWVGSKCIDKFLTHLKEQKNQLLKVERYKDQGFFCKYCNEILPGMRTKINRELYCNRNCKSKMEYVIPFGKHKNKNMIELICTREGLSYINWCKKVIEDDSNAFHRFPLFLEILNENVLQEQEEEEQEEGDEEEDEEL